MFKLKLDPKKDYHCGQHGYIQRKSDGYNVCRVESWGFTSCAVGVITQMSHYMGNTLEEIDQLFKFICENVAEDWSPNEFYFMVSDYQLKAIGCVQLMVTHPNVKKRDVFKNKAHGPNKVHLYRYSLEKDFPAITSRKKKEPV